MSIEQLKFDPKDPKYKKVSDLPEEEQHKYVDDDGGFVAKNAINTVREAGGSALWKNQEITKIEKLFGKRKTTVIDELHTEAINDEVTQKEKLKDPNAKLSWQLEGLGYGDKKSLFILDPLIRRFGDRGAIPCSGDAGSGYQLFVKSVAISKSEIAIVHLDVVETQFRGNLITKEIPRSERVAVCANGSVIWIYEDQINDFKELFTKENGAKSE